MGRRIKKRFTLTLEPELFERLQEYCEINQVNRLDFISGLIRDALEKPNKAQALTIQELAWELTKNQSPSRRAIDKIKSPREQALKRTYIRKDKD